MSIHKYLKSNKTFWYVKYKNTTKRGFKTKKEAEIYESKLKIGEDKTIDQYKKFSIIADEYLEYQYNHYEYGTYQKSCNLIKNIILPNIRDKPINEYTDKECIDIWNFINNLEYSTTYKNDILSRFKSVFKYAKKIYHIKNDPSEYMERYKSTLNENKEKKDRELNIWTVEEFNRFIECVDNDVYKRLFVVLYYSGMRLGEALALKWIDYKNGYLDVYKNVTRKSENNTYEIKNTKTTSSIRKIYLPDNICEYIDEFKNKEMLISGYNEDWFIFNRMKPLSTSTIERIKNNACKKSGVKCIRIHDIRHSHASNLIGEGINIVAVSKRLGHSDINMTLKTYTHLLEKNNETLLEYLNKTSQNLLKI